MQDSFETATYLENSCSVAVLFGNSEKSDTFLTWWCIPSRHCNIALAWNASTNAVVLRKSLSVKKTPWVE